MLSISIVTADGAASYFAEESGKGKDYWARDAKESTCWHGKGAEALGLAGAVRPDTFQSLMEGKLPSGKQLPGGAGGERRAGYDLTFSAPKSVSLVGIVGGDERVLAAHDAAMKAALDYVECETSQTRIKADGITTTEKTGNLVAAVFRHDMSRNHDPQLHSHAVVANMTRSADGQWRALSNEEILAHKMTAGAVYRAELAAGLREIGYDELRQTKDAFEIAQIPQEAIDAFSTRRAEIVQSMKDAGMTGAKAAEVAALDTRSAKVVLDEHGREVQAEAWTRTAAAAGLTGEQSLENITASARARWHHDFSNTQQVKDELAARELERAQAAKAAVRHAIEHLSERQSVFQRRELIQHAANHGAPHGVDLARIEHEIGQRIKYIDLVKVGELLTTREALEREIRTVHTMRHGQGATASVSANADRIEKLSEGLTDGQRDALRLALTSRDQVIGIEGKAGTGKTTMLSRVVQEAQAQGYEVKGLAPSAQAAKVLQDETGAKSATLSKHLMPSPERAGQARPQIWIVDEAGMMSTRQADALLQKAQAANARVILVGDRQQLSAVEAGKPFAVLADKGMAVARMDEIMRQKDAELKAAVEKIIAHRGQQAVQDMSGSIREIEGREARLDAVAESFLARDVSERKGIMVITDTNRDRQDLNSRIRDGLRQEGQLRGPRTEVTQLIKSSMTKAQMKQSHNYEQGMQVRFGRDYESLGVKKGEVLEVAGGDQKKGLVQLRGEDGRTVDWSPSRNSKVEAFKEQKADLQAGDQVRFTRNEYDLNRLNGHTAEVLGVDKEARTAQIRLASGQEQTMQLDSKQEQTWTHAYASTVHASQGATCDRAIIAVDTSQGMASEQSMYVGVSRARHGIEIHTDNQQKLGEMAEREASQGSALEAVQGVGHNPEGSLLEEYYGIGLDDGMGTELGEEQEMTQDAGQDMGEAEAGAEAAQEQEMAM